MLENYKPASPYLLWTPSTSLPCSVPNMSAVFADSESACHLLEACREGI